MFLRRSPLRTALIALAAAPLTLGLVACGSDGDSDNDSAPAPSASTSEGSASNSPSAAATSDAALLAAGNTALGAVDGTVFSISSDSGSWEVQVVTADGTENELQISGDGGTVERGPGVDKDDDANDLAERKQLLTDAKLDFAAAVDAARGSVPDGAVTEVDLDMDRGQATWDVQFDEDTANEQTVTVDAVTGEILSHQGND